MHSAKEVVRGAQPEPKNEETVPSNSGAILERPEPQKPVYRRDANNQLYELTPTGMRKIGRMVRVGDENGEREQPMGYDYSRAPANKKERRKAKQGLPFRTKGGELVK